MAAHADESDLLNDHTYDVLVAWGRRWIPMITTIFAVLGLIFMELSKVPGLEAAAPWMITISGICSVFDMGLNEYLKRAKALYISETENTDDRE